MYFFTKSLVCLAVSFHLGFAQLLLPILRPSAQSSPSARNLRPTGEESVANSAYAARGSDRDDNVGEESNNRVCDSFVCWLFYENRCFNFQPADPYNFGYDTKDQFGNQHYRKEQSDGSGTIRGTYGYQDTNGLYRIVEYIADATGFRAKIKSNEPGLGQASPADIALEAQEAPKGAYQAAASNEKPVTEVNYENKPIYENKPRNVERPVYSLYGNRPTGRLQYLAAAPLPVAVSSTSTSTHQPESS